jgi:hypothetical protein
MLTRRDEWPALLEEFLKVSHGKQFRYGRFDCCLFVADAIAAMTGTDIARESRGYHSRKQALCGQSVEQIVSGIAEDYDMPEVPVLMAGRGDMILIPRPRDFSLGLVSMNGTEILIALRAGYGAIPLSSGVRAWKV